MRPATELARTVGWLRVDLATVRVTDEEARELRTGDVVLVESVVRSDRGESGSALLVLHDGRRYVVSIALRSGSWFAKVMSRDESIGPPALAISLVHHYFDAVSTSLVSPAQPSRSTPRQPTRC